MLSVMPRTEWTRDGETTDGEISGVHATPVAVKAADPSALIRVGFAYAITLILLATLAPFRFSLEALGSAELGELVIHRRDLLRNLVLLAPVGFLYRLWAPRRTRWGLDALLLGAGLSVAVEACQLLLPTRSPSVLDILCNAGGAWVGADLARQLRPWVSRQLAWQLTHGSPLGHVMLPLSVSIVASAMIDVHLDRPWMVAPLGLAGAIVLSAHWRHGQGAAGRLSLLGLAVRAAVWMGVCMMPLWTREPLMPLGCALLTGAGTYAAGRTGVPGASGRRFELPAVRWVMAGVLVHMAMTGLRPLYYLYIESAVVVQGPGKEPLVLIEHFSLLTVVGYLSAAWVGRRFRRDLGPVVVAVVSVGLVASVLGLARALAPGAGAAFPVQLAALLAGLWGGLLYCAQRQLARHARQPQRSPALFAIT